MQISKNTIIVNAIVIMVPLVSSYIHILQTWRSALKLLQFWITYSVSVHQVFVVVVMETCVQAGTNIKISIWLSVEHYQIATYDMLYLHKTSW